MNKVGSWHYVRKKSIIYEKCICVTMVKMRLILSLQLHSVVRPSIKPKTKEKRENEAKSKLQRRLVQRVVSVNRVGDTQPRKSENKLTARAAHICWK